MPKTIGTVISTFEGPSTFQFNFVIKEDSEKIPVHKGQFIQIRQRKSKESSRLGVNFEDAIVSFNNGCKKSEKDLDAFM
ncbi:MAG: hypothetical protein NTW30_03585 [Candidatus Aenigmarchaeota archaeon]|nr:hypothetical protein [Candidatus Aenigmarchaeota archaeon]